MLVVLIGMRIFGSMMLHTHFVSANIPIRTGKRRSAHLEKSHTLILPPPPLTVGFAGFNISLS